MTLQIEQWPIGRFVEYAKNPRKNDHAIDAMAMAIREFGFRVPIIAKSDGLIVDGHLRLKAAQKIGLIELPVVLADDLTDVQIKALRLSINKMAELAEWNMELLAGELHSLNGERFELGLLGFDAPDLEALMFDGVDYEPESSTKEIDPDEYALDHKCPKCGFEFDD